MRRKRFALLVCVPAVALAGAALWKHEKLVTAYWEYRLVCEVDSVATPLLRLGRMLEAAVNMDTETDSYAVSILPRPEAIERFARDLGIHKDKLPEAKGRETEATIFMIRSEAERPAPEARERER